jgi:ribosomal protein L32
MSVRMRHTRAHTANRRSHHALSEPAVSNDAKDGAHLRHRVSPITGKYKGEQILNATAKVSKKAEAKKETKKKSTTKDEK